VLALIYEGLTTLDKHLQPLPALAARWDISADGLVYTIHLRRGVQFHHGKELDAADVRYSFQQAATVTTSQQEERAPFAFVAAIHTPDSHTVRFLLKQPYAPFLSKLTVLSCPIVPDGAPSTAQAVPPGTGPFEVERFQPGEAVLLKKFAAYWESGLPRLDTLILRRVEYATARLQLLQRGEVDFVMLDPRYQHTPAPEADGNIVLVNSAPTGTFSLVFHTQRQPFSNANVRRAVALALDKAALAQDVLGEYGVPVNQPFAPDTSPWYSNVPERPRDLDKARAILTEAGFPQGLTVSLPVIADAALFVKTAQALQKLLQPAGIRLQVEILPEASVQERLQQGTWDLLLRGEESSTDPDDVYFATLHSSTIDHSNISGYNAPALDTLLVTARQTLEVDKRREVYRQVLRQVHDDVPELSLFMVRWPVAWRRNVQGYAPELLRCCFQQTLTLIANQGFKTMWRTP
jgi:peptide/nickel transport system substrate-binding protein